MLLLQAGTAAANKAFWNSVASSLAIIGPAAIVFLLMFGIFTYVTIKWLFPLFVKKYNNGSNIVRPQECALTRSIVDKENFAHHTDDVENKLEQLVNANSENQIYLKQMVNSARRTEQYLMIIAYKLGGNVDTINTENDN
jgi:hypothetical protein